MQSAGPQEWTNPAGGRDRTVVERSDRAAPTAAGTAAVGEAVDDDDDDDGVPRAGRGAVDVVLGAGGVVVAVGVPAVAGKATTARVTSAAPIRAAVSVRCRFRRTLDVSAARLPS